MIRRLVPQKRKRPQNPATSSGSAVCIRTHYPFRLRAKRGKRLRLLADDRDARLGAVFTGGYTDLRHMSFGGLDGSEYEPLQTALCVGVSPNKSGQHKKAHLPSSFYLSLSLSKVTKRARAWLPIRLTKWRSTSSGLVVQRDRRLMARGHAEHLSIWWRFSTRRPPRCHLVTLTRLVATLITR